nr:PREDICTED: E3 ubiquitin-protein ligase RDUF1-like [Daucus carota subsp. sativus]
MESTEPSHWCHGCNSYVRVHEGQSVVCLDCGAGFVETIRDNAATFEPHYNPFIVLRRIEDTGSYELLYDDCSGQGLRPLLPGMSELVMGRGFDRVLEHFIRSDTMTVTQPPAAKAAGDALPAVKINLGHIISDAHCAVCTEAFEANALARELPCKHLYHSDCILPWLEIRNSCPVCRYELAPDVAEMDELEADNDEEPMGLIIWRLPRGGYAIGRFNGGRGLSEGEAPGADDEMDDEDDVDGSSSTSRSWSRSGMRRGGIRHAFRSVLSFFGRFRSSSSSRLNMEVGFSEDLSRGNSRRRVIVDA